MFTTIRERALSRTKILSFQRDSDTNRQLLDWSREL